MTIEAAMGEAGVLHDRVEADAVEAFLAKQPGSGIDDPLPILGRLHLDRQPESAQLTVGLTAVEQARDGFLAYVATLGK